jgi:putative transposase
VVEVKARTRLGRAWKAEGIAPAATIAKVLRISRQALYEVPSRPCQTDPDRPKRSVPPPLPLEWQAMQLGPSHCSLEEALHVLARRHPAAGYRKVCSRARRKGFVVNRKKVARLLREWGFTRRRPKPHPKQQGRPFDVVAPNVLWQTDLTAVWCGEDGWAYFCGVIDCFDRSLLSWTFTQRCRARDVSPALEQAFSVAFPYADDEINVVVRHDNGTQFTSIHYRDVASVLGIKLSRTAYRHPDGNAFIERLYRTLKEECVWCNDFQSFDEALAAITAWTIDYNTERPHDSLGQRTPEEARMEALDQLNSAA